MRTRARDAADRGLSGFAHGLRVEQQRLETGVAGSAASAIGEVVTIGTPPSRSDYQVLRDRVA